jgi:Tripartite tricarboxylate transporter family receptor
MKFPRRRFLHLAVGTAALPALSRLARAQIYPTRPVRVIVGFPPGGPSDILARLIGQWLSERLGQPFLVENRPRATGNIATEAVTRAPADGHTLLLVVPANAISVALYDNLKLNFNFIRDTTPVSGISIGPLVMEVNLTIPVNTVPEFIAYAKANPGKINFASPGNGAAIAPYNHQNTRYRADRRCDGAMVQRRNEAAARRPGQATRRRRSGWRFDGLMVQRGSPSSCSAAVNLSVAEQLRVRCLMVCVVW